MSSMATVPSEALGKKLVEKNVVVSVEFEASAPQAMATRLIDLKKALGGSGNIVLTTTERVVRSPMGDVAQTPRQKTVDAAKQQMYLALVKGGWTKDEIYSMVGVTAATAGADAGHGRHGRPAPGRQPGEADAVNGERKTENGKGARWRMPTGPLRRAYLFAQLISLVTGAAGSHPRFHGVFPRDCLDTAQA